MAQIKSLKELADLGFVIAFRFYGRYPETGRSFYHPPPCDGHGDPALSASNNIRRHSPARRPGLTAATSFILPSLSAPSLSVFFSSGAAQDYDVLPSPASQNVGAH